jgi:hypothetical protein
LTTGPIDIDGALLCSCFLEIVDRVRQDSRGSTPIATVKGEPLNFLAAQSETPLAAQYPGDVAQNNPTSDG